MLLNFAIPNFFPSCRKLLEMGLPFSKRNFCIELLILASNVSTTTSNEDYKSKSYKTCIQKEIRICSNSKVKS